MKSCSHQREEVSFGRRQQNDGRAMASSATVPTFRWAEVVRSDGNPERFKEPHVLLQQRVEPSSAALMRLSSTLNGASRIQTT